MPNRIDDCLNRLRAAQRKAFIPYICAGDPSFATTVELARALEKSGADILELGVPFSDPLADGIVNQLAAQRALAGGATPRGVLNCVRQIRATSQIPIVLYTYLNPILQFGWEKFHAEAQSAGVDGLLILDLPPEEDVSASPDVDWLNQSSLTSANVPANAASSAAGLDESQWPMHIRLIAPTTPAERIAAIAADARGFIYYVSREGVTGAQQTVAASLEKQLSILRRSINLPIAVGFGISTPAQARAVAREADGVVVGSAIVDLIAKGGADSIAAVAAFARSIADAIN